MRDLDVVIEVPVDGLAPNDLNQQQAKRQL